MVKLNELLYAAEAEAREARVDWRAGTLDVENRIPELADHVEHLTAALRLAICQRDYWVVDETPLMDKYNAQLETILKGGARGE